MINFTVGPVQMSDAICAIGGEQVPYFRTEEFSKMILESETLMKKMLNANQEDRVLFITGSGTASMEATVINTLSPKDKVLIVNGGTFGQRFVDLCRIYGIEYTEILLKPGVAISSQVLDQYDDGGYTAFAINIHETSTGVHYDLDLVSRFCKRNNLFFIVDAISSFLADELDMKKEGIDVVITGSQKALACQPGISIIVLSTKAITRVLQNDPHCMYLNLKEALNNAIRGQTPFTPAVGILRQINYRLREIDKIGVLQMISSVSELAKDFRTRIIGLPFEFFSNSMSNAVTALHPLTASAYDIYLTLKNDYNIWVCPNGGGMKDLVFRVGHIGALTKDDNTQLINAFYDMQRRGLI